MIFSDGTPSGPMVSTIPCSRLKSRTGNAGLHVDGQVVTVFCLRRIEDFFTADLFDPTDGAATWQRRSKPQILYGFHSVHVESDSIVDALYIDRGGDNILQITVERTERVGIAAAAGSRV